jgi:hypothetical protein
MKTSTTTKHTPGPWHHSDPRTGRIYISSKITQVAVIPYLDDEAEANAALICTAPDMLALLQEIETREVFRPDDWPRIRAAIAKATGIL